MYSASIWRENGVTGCSLLIGCAGLRVEIYLTPTNEFLNATLECLSEVVSLIGRSVN